MRGIFFGADTDGVAGIGSAAVADDDIGPFGEEIDEFSLSLVAPLKSDDTGVLLLEGYHSLCALSKILAGKAKARKVEARAQGVKDAWGYQTVYHAFDGFFRCPVSTLSIVCAILRRRVSSRFA
jgi:hypothetical protein